MELRGDRITATATVVTTHLWDRVELCPAVSTAAPPSDLNFLRIELLGFNDDGAVKGGGAGCPPYVLEGLP
jgi:hypothetical protein